MKLRAKLLIYISKKKTLLKIFTFFLILIVLIYNYKLLFVKTKKKGFALSANRFRDDLEILNQSKKIKIYKIPLKIQYNLISPYENLIKKFKSNYFDNSNEIENQKKVYDHYLKNILKYFFEYFKFNFVLSAAVHYIQDYDIANIAQKYGVKYIIFQRENFGIIEYQSNKVKQYYSSYKPSGADIIVTQNLNTAEMLKSLDVGSKSKVINLGCLRMENFINSLKNPSKKIKNKRKKTITFFSFAPNVGINLSTYPPRVMSAFGGEGLIDFFKNSHNEIINFAKNNDDIKLVIKTKWQKNWVDKIINNWKLQTKSSIPNNCTITSTATPHELIKNSDLVISFNSTTILESGLMNIPVIIPKFDEAINKYSEYYDLKEYENIFIIEENQNELKNKIRSCLNNFKLTNEQRLKRNYLFEKYVSPLNLSISDEYINILNNA